MVRKKKKNLGHSSFGGSGNLTIIMSGVNNSVAGWGRCPLHKQEKDGSAHQTHHKQPTNDGGRNDACMSRTAAGRAAAGGTR
eukprot:m.47676 g.47676  ORF g.47676 m.47676 type:complete len:82 (+) comp17687_c0_seq1:103-348(+)